MIGRLSFGPINRLQIGAMGAHQGPPRRHIAPPPLGKGYGKIVRLFALRGHQCQISLRKGRIRALLGQYQPRQGGVTVCHNLRPRLGHLRL